MLPTPHATPRRKYVKVTFPNPWRTDAPLSARIHNANSRTGKAAREVSPPATPLLATTTTSKQNFFHSRSQRNETLWPSPFGRPPHSSVAVPSALHGKTKPRFELSLVCHGGKSFDGS